MPDQATLLALLRGLHLASTLSLLGVTGFLAWILPVAGAAGRIMIPTLVRLWWTSGVLALLMLAGWFVLESAAIAGATDWDDLLVALPVVATQTRFGQVVVARGGLLLIGTCLAGSARWEMHWRRLYPALLLIAVALGLQGLIGHAGAIGGELGDGIVVSEALHLIAAGLWLGALLPLWRSVGRLANDAAGLVCERFTPIGLACVLVIAGTGLAQGMELIGSIPALFGTAYGHVATLKIALFLATLALAACNRLWLTDRLVHGAQNAGSRLRLSIILETAIGLAIVLAAAFLASSSPAAHDQPVWPFPWRFSLVTMNEDPDFRSEVLVSLGLIAVSGLAFVAALVRRRLRLLMLAVLIGMIAWRTPSFALLLVEAYPTSYQTSPTGFSAASIVRGAALYGPNCAGCHGASGAGNGPRAAGLRIAPADLTAPHLWDHADGELFWWLTHGMDDPEGGLAMPGFPGLSVDDRWALIDYIRAHNAGLAMQHDTASEVPVQAPALSLRCADSPATRMSDLHGSVVHVVAAPDAPAVPRLPGLPVVTLLLGGDPAANACVVTDPAARDAFAVLADLPPDRLPGTEFLVDPNGWLRAVRRPDTEGGWHTSDQLIAAERGIYANPIQQPSGGSHDHHH